MAWIPLAVSAVGAIGSMMSGQHAAGVAEDLGRQQLGLGRDQLAFQREVYGDEKARRDKAYSYLTPYVDDPNLFFSEYKDKLDKNYQDGFRQQSESAARNGTAGSGMDEGFRRSSMLKKASDLSKGWLSGRMASLDIAKSLLGSSNPLGASGQVLSANGSLMGAMGNQMGMFNNNALQAMQGAGSAMASGAQAYAYLDRPGGNPTTPPPTTPTVPKK